MIRLSRVEKIYRRGAEDVHALRGVELDISAGEFISVIGPSGAGKTTMLHLLGCLDLPTSGTVLFDGLDVGRMSDAELTGLRREKIGFVFQQFYLLPGLTVFDNIALPLLFSRKKSRTRDIRTLAETVGLQERLQHVPAQLSGGEMQRVAIARALVNNPEIILADEPTGNLDSDNSEKIFSLLRLLHAQGITVAMITHNHELAARADRVVGMKDGVIVRDGRQGRPESGAQLQDI